MTLAAPCWQPAYVGLGSNLEEPVAQLERAFDALASLPSTHLIRRSALWRSAPMGPPDQPDYVNAAAGLLTQLAAHVLLGELQRIEHAQGRRRDGQRWGPRTLDLDLLVFAAERHESETLTVPHPGIAERSFVLAPLAQVAPGLTVPGVGSVTGLLAAVDCGDIVPLESDEH
ncbi:MAG: 2-amino-4-hydroxy-6-hydroxymethyldihydropteridine diphosphokinase [Pseudomonadota bacterium]